VPESTTRNEPLLNWMQKSYDTAFRDTAAAVVPSDSRMIATLTKIRFENLIATSTPPSHSSSLMRGSLEAL